VSFQSLLVKVRTISKAATVTPKRLLAFESCCKAANLKPLRPIRDHAIRWNATYHMLERAVYLRKAIDVWAKSNQQFIALQMSPREWDMVEFLVQFLYPFMVASTTIQATAQPSLSDTWVVYEELFDTLEEIRAALAKVTALPDWMKETQEAIEGMWTKLRTYYDKTSKPFAYVDATLLHPALKTRFMKRAGYGDEMIQQYIKEAEARYQQYYDPPDLSRQRSQSRPATHQSKRRRTQVDSSDSDSSNGKEYNEFSSYMQMKRDSTVKDELPWWKGSQTLYHKLTKMVRDMFAVPATGAGVEREFSISGRVITKYRNRLTTSVIRDLMQYKR
jgi:hAT family C-terminal dimerisation region